MTDKLKQITEKIYNEGILKANEDADKIISEAKNEAQKILEQAKSEKTEIIKKAKKEVEEIQKNTQTEIKLATRQSISNLKQQISELVATSQLQKPISESFSDVDFVKKIMLTMIQNWDSKNQAEPDLTLMVPEKDLEDFTHFVENSTKSILDKGVEILPDPKLKAGFKIGPKDGSYIISFSEDDFENFFKKYFKERTRKLLFEKNPA